MKPILISHPTGNQNVRAAAEGFADHDMLYKFFTCIASFPDGILYRLSSLSFLSELKRRSFDSKLRTKTSTWPWTEAGRLLSIKFNLKKFTEHEKGTFSVDSVYRNFDAYVANRLKKASESGVGGIYAYEDGAAYTFAAAKQLGVKCFYDLPIGYWREGQALLEEEKKRWPQWKSTLVGFKDSKAKLARKDEELRLADQIFVASSFTALTLKSYPHSLAPIHVIPYGFPDVGNKKEYDLQLQRPLKILFVGGLSQRKGIADLLAVVDKIGKDVMLTIVGRKATEDCIPLNEALKRHTWIPSLPHQSVLKLMREHDVLVFPSLFEGFGLVITEAMSQGTPVITTDRTVGPDLIKDGENGWLIEGGSTKALQSAIEHLLNHFNDIAKAGNAAIETAKQRPWKCYGDELATVLLKLNFEQQ